MGRTKHGSGKRGTSQEKDKHESGKRRGTSQEKEEAQVREKGQESGITKHRSRETKSHESGKRKGTSQENARESGKRP